MSGSVSASQGVAKAVKAMETVLIAAAARLFEACRQCGGDLKVAGMVSPTDIVKATRY